MARGRRRPPRSGALTELPPLKILSQILALQALYYTTATVLILFASLVAGTPFSLSLIFSWESVRGDLTQGWVWGFIWLLNGGLFIPLQITLLIARSKLVPDFALTLHFIHLLVTSLYTHSLPRHAMWWMIMALSSFLSTTLGIWGCRYRELRPISFGGSANTGSSGNGEGSSAAGAGGDGDEEQGFTRGRGRTRGRDGGGEYEMVSVKGEEGER